MARPATVSLTGVKVADVLADLRAALPDGRLITDRQALRPFHRDEADLCPAGAPLAAVRVKATAEVAAVLRVASAHRVGVVAQGARTGLAGGANAHDGAIVLDLTGMNAIIDIDPVNRVARVQPGVVNADLARAVAAVGLRYPPDPGSWESSTIGGNVATNAGGMCCVKYGVTGEYVLGLEVVLASGEVLRCGRRTRKGVAGYDLTRLFVGSEGTLGVITEVTVGLRPAAEESLGLVALFDSMSEAGAAVREISLSGAVPSLLELLDRVHLRAIEAHHPIGLPDSAAAMLLASVDSGSAAAEHLAAIALCCARAGASEVYEAATPDEARSLLAARRLAHPAMESFARSIAEAGALVIDDLCVPVNELARCLDGIAEIAARTEVIIGVVGHAGDGNLHPNIVVDRADPASLERGAAAFDQIMALCLDLGGTCTGEHGIGLLKREWLATELGPVGLRLHHAIKHAFDPLGVLNPGKVLPDRG